MKKLLNKILLIFIISVFYGCKEDERNNLTKAENVIKDTYASQFVTFSGEIDQANPIQLYKKIEDYYLFLNLLESTSRSNYGEFFKTYVQTDSTINLDCLYNNYPSSESLILPTNLTHNFYAFEQGVNSQRLDKESQLALAHEALLKMKSGMDLEINDIERINDYLNSIQEADFQNKIIYRIPLIAFSHVILSEREQHRKNKERRNN